MHLKSLISLRFFYLFTFLAFSIQNFNVQINHFKRFYIGCILGNKLFHILINEIKISSIFYQEEKNGNYYQKKKGFKLLWEIYLQMFISNFFYFSFTVHFLYTNKMTVLDYDLRELPWQGDYNHEMHFNCLKLNHLICRMMT